MTQHAVERVGPPDASSSASSRGPPHLPPPWSGVEASLFTTQAWYLLLRAMDPCLFGSEICAFGSSTSFGVFLKNFTEVLLFDNAVFFSSVYSKQLSVYVHSEK